MPEQKEAAGWAGALPVLSCVYLPIERLAGPVC